MGFDSEALQTLTDRIAIVVCDYRGGLLNGDEDAACVILEAIRQPTEPMCELRYEVIARRQSSSWVWPEIIDAAKFRDQTSGV